jgi:hypothetical protein
MLRSQVDVVGLHFHSAGQPCLNLTVIPFDNPSGGTDPVPVMNLNNFVSTSTLPTNRKRS